MTKSYTITFPGEIADILELSDQKGNDVLRVELAIHFYEHGKLSFGKARELSQLSVWEFIDLLRERKIPLDYNEQEYEQDKKIIESFKK